MKRRWFQVHLSTVIVLVFMAGTFLLLNFRKYNIRDYDNPEPTLDGRTVNVVSFDVGFPFEAYHGANLIWIKPATRPPETVYIAPRYGGIAKNGFVLVVLLGAVSTLLEFVSRREVRKP